MIVPMTKYELVLYAAQSEDFIARLRELGLVDITTTAWEPSDEDRALLTRIEQHDKAVVSLKGVTGAEPYRTGAEALTAYEAAAARAATLNAEIAALRKFADEARPWGDFDASKLEKLAEQGVALRFFVAPRSVFSELSDVEEISETQAGVHFVQISQGDEEVQIDAQEVRPPVQSAAEAEVQIALKERELQDLDAEFARAGASAALIEADAAALKRRLELTRIERTAATAADGQLLVLEGWAEAATADKVDALLEEYPNVVFIKSRPTPGDDTPVQLHNRPFARLFELIGNMYAAPKYGTIDLTRFFAPFYMVFFGFCLAEGGYGLLIMLLGLLAVIKFKDKPLLKQVGWLSMLCGFSGMLFGLMSGSFFGLQMSTWEWLGDIRGHLLTPDILFPLSIALGGVQVIFAMIIAAWVTARSFGLKYALASIGWIIVLLSCVAAYLAGAMHSIPFYAALGVGGVLMFFFNSPGKNPLLNFGLGIWNTYNNVSGLVGDLLSYIRLFAIGLSGGILAMVFNQLAVGMAPDVPVARELVMALILLIGHGINLFMCILSSFVHPLRLTFVEFYKNAGFEAATRVFKPLKNN